MGGGIGKIGGALGGITGSLTSAGAFGGQAGKIMGQGLGTVADMGMGNYPQAPGLAGGSGYPGGRPTLPGFDSQLQDNGLLKDIYQYKDPGGRVGLDAMRAEATRTGPSAWAQLQRTNQMDDISRAAAGAQSRAMNQTAMMGGLGSGAQERIARSGLRDKLLAQQGALGGIAAQDEANRMGMLQRLPTAELQEATFNRQGQQYNIDNALQEVLARRGYDLKKYEEDMKGYGAERTAAAAPQQEKFNLFNPGSWGIF